MGDDLRLPWRISRTGRIVDSHDYTVASAIIPHIAEAIVKAVNAHHEQQEMLAMWVATPRDIFADDLSDSLRKGSDDRAAIAGRMVPRREPSEDPGRFGVETIGGTTTWYATLEEAWMHMGEGRRIVRR